jgi:hypothetical protein
VRRFKLQVQTSIDGYMASANGEAGGMDGRGLHPGLGVSA